MRWRGPFESAALLTALPVPRWAATSTRGVLPWAPLIGLLLGGVATGIAVLGGRFVSPLVGGVLGIAALALLTRGLHLDGLADTADGLGPLRGRERALAVMRQSDIGPFGVVTLVLTLLTQVACLAALLTVPAGWAAFCLAVVASRVAMTRTGLPGVPTAEGSALGQAVAGTVSPRWAAGCAVALAALIVVAARGDADVALRLFLGVAAGLLAAELVQRRARARLGGVTGDVMGAMAEVTTAIALLAAAALLR
jgi:cobalamin 5'-phosphate synthase/cobalamin synthase